MVAVTTGPDPTVCVLPSAEVVGSAFVSQYYSILRSSPALAYRFYHDASRMGRAGPGGFLASTSTMAAINEKIQSYGSLRADVKFVDAQESYNGGVLVLVTGFMVDADESRQRFTQTFFLAPQEKGYYVLNDIFRYVEDEEQNEEQDGGIAPPTSSQEETSPLQENHISEQSSGEVYDPSENGEVPVEEVQAEEDEEEEEPVAEVVDETPVESQVVVESQFVVETSVQVKEAPKKSYASIVMKDKPAALSPPNLSKSVPRMQEQQPVLQSPISVTVPMSSATDTADDGSNQESEGDGYAIYVKNLPANVSLSMVEEAFQRFGPIKKGGIQIRNSGGYLFGFVEFETAAAAQNAVEATRVRVGGREVVVEEKKSSSSRGNYRGRYPSGRGGNGFRGDRGRGRGSYGGGRGYSRGESNKNDFGGRGGSRGYQNHSEGYQRTDQTGNGDGRTNRGGGPGFGTTRPQRVSAQA